MRIVKTLALCLALSIAATGCGKPASNQPIPGIGSTTPPAAPDPAVARNAEIIHLATSESVSIGLSVYAKSHPAEAANIATKIKEISGTTALAYLNGSSGASSAAVNGFLNSQFVALPPDATQLIALAAALLDQFLPAPDAATFLTDAQFTYLKAFFQGLNDGAAQYLAGVVPTTPKYHTKAVRGHWLNGN